MATRTTYTFRAFRGEARYQAKCSSCGKTVTRLATAEHTVNPFNIDDTTKEPKSASQVSREAQAEAEALAAKKEGEIVVCRDCEEAPMKALLLEMAAEPGRVFPGPGDREYYGSPMATLVHRGHAEEAWERCKCGEPCCSGHRRLGGFRVTKKGQIRAGKFK